MQDGRGPPTMLTEKVLNKLNLEKVDDLIGWAYNKEDQGWSKFADLASLATECAALGDKEALRILNDATDSIMVRNLIK